MDIEVVIFLVVAAVAVLLFLRQPAAKEPVALHNPNHQADGCTSVIIAAVTLCMSLMALGALVGGGAADVGVYEVARRAGDDAVTMTVLLFATGSLAALAMVNGVAFKLSFFIFLLCVVGSVAYVSSLGG